MIQKAAELVSPGEKAIVIFTRGDHFVRDGQGSGHTGNWYAGEGRLNLLDKVIIFRQDEHTGVNTIYMGIYVGSQQSPEPRRKTILFSGLRDYGVTTSNWIDFGGRSRTAFFYYPEAGSW